MRIGIDYDGVISANFQHYFQLAHDFNKSGHKVYVITAANYERNGEIIDNLNLINFPCEDIITRPFDFKSTTKNIGLWKKSILKKFKIDLWFDNEIKAYEKAKVDFSDLKTVIVRV